MTNGILDQSILAHFTGTDYWYKHGLALSILYTDGAKYVAETAGAYWLLDEIALSQMSEQAVKAEEFQVWISSVNADHTATLTCEDGNDNPVYSKALEFTNFPPEGITLWFANNVIYLPSEH